MATATSIEWTETTWNPAVLGAPMLPIEGAHTLVQDRETSLVWGMPRVELGAAELEMPIDAIADAVLQMALTRAA